MDRTRHRKPAAAPLDSPGIGRFRTGGSYVIADGLAP